MKYPYEKRRPGEQVGLEPRQPENRFALAQTAFPAQSGERRPAASRGRRDMTDTIAAPATAPARAALGVLRVSGPDALDIAARLFDGLRDLPDRHMAYGRITDGAGGTLDTGLAVVFRAPRSYTGEDVAEFHLHGSPAILTAVLQALCRHGARPAGPGEFTKRAFLNRRMDLTQAEATLDLIQSETVLAARNAAEQARGALGRAVRAVYESVTGLIAHFQAAVDFPEEDIAGPDTDALRETLAQAQTALQRLLGSYARGRVLRDGARAALVGRPNTGKSSLLNALLGYDRAIVSDLPGTTRDTLEESVRLGGVLLRLTDAAGLRHTADATEAEGTVRAVRAAQDAELLLAVLDGSEPLREDDRAVLALAGGAPHALVLVNKSDLSQKLDLSALGEFGPIVSVSAKTGAGLDTLADAVGEMFHVEHWESDGTALSNLRQYDALARAGEALREADAALRDGMTPDAALGELETGLDALAEALGRRVSEDVVNGIFSRFCVGK
jgi:tRNA modification GTPase